MRLLDFVLNACATEETALRFLRQHNVLESEALCPGKRGVACMRVMREEVYGNGKRRWRCPRKSCQTTRSVRASNAFFHYVDSTGRMTSRLPLREILVLVWLWVHARMPERMVRAVTGKSTATIVDWNHFCRTTCGKVMDLQPKLVGTSDAPVKIDESYVCGRRKYGKGRLLSGDKPGKGETKVQNNSDEILGWNETMPEDELEVDSSDDFVRFGIDDPNWRWVVGIWQSKTQCRFIRVPNRTKQTLNAVIHRYVAAGSYIETDRWAGYNDLNALGYVHTTVNHTENYVDPITGAHTNEIEGAWNAIKDPYKRMHGNRKHLQSHLDEAAWRMLRSAGEKPERLFAEFLSDVRVVHGNHLVL